MSDFSIPSLSLNLENVMHISIPSTQALLEDQGYTYNQSGLTYDQLGVMYGGIFNQNQDILPLLVSTFSEQPTLIIPQEVIKMVISATQALLADQGYTYNQAGLTYDQLGVQYGGVYNQDQDVLPLELSFTDIYATSNPPITNSGMLMGMLGLTYP
jgi:hypothetical protein